MPTKKELGKIESVSFGYGGYQGVMFGMSLTFEGKGWGVSTFDGFWGPDIEVSGHTKWTEADRSKHYDEVMRKVAATLKQAKVKSVDDLKGIPVEVTFDQGTLVGWRILEEVL
jgi:hypothetical protein